MMIVVSLQIKTFDSKLQTKRSENARGIDFCTLRSMMILS